MTYKQKVRQLTVTMYIGVVMLACIVYLGKDAFVAFLFADTVSGEVVEYSIAKERPAYLNVSQRTPERHEVLIEYFVEGVSHWIWVNSHAYSASGLLSSGDTVTIAYNKHSPEYGYVMTYALFSTLASILWPFLVLILLVVTPQWLHVKSKVKHE
ncbi:hypothetical protein Q4561_14085 [Alteromonas sp. 1_MG-2023]|uniref:hypothetical protein n=1 Tax=Alteromonas sp. 1_MG-2023 TaxID=3062669 RepID=UPI0026E352F6|nr:hypothetical protein [Alteromonas sp. 1_MG-2023]MDO6568198.1 hypothetical protein [Alteromonas sp. 1_MG-2023]